MSPILKQVQLAVAAALIAAMLALGVGFYYQRHKIVTLEQKVAASSADIAGLKERTARLEAVRKTQEKKNAAIDKASEAHPEWADAVVPDDVVCVLRGTCSP